MSVQAYFHTQARLWVRYDGLTLTLAAYRQLCHHISLHADELTATPLESGRQIVPLTYEGRAVHWVWCPSSQLIVTVLPARLPRDRPRGSRTGAVRRQSHDKTPYRRPRCRWDEVDE
ncbi:MULTISPECIES: hypothetical protein [Deinococcus]|uniref:Uncharacterized protein n=1 Tax=Deinococcus rufus TaxID=2136097 RepID=A0ABV7ZF72_9DEIO|nr:hypothetical protein [Deinococcus sp. AB2017081]WQE94062.1 hypothetical protein U2P90_11645 [Deinococcus sp. AB2017081]